MGIYRNKSALRPNAPPSPEQQQDSLSHICRHGQRIFRVPIHVFPLAIIMIHIIQHNPSNSPDYSSPFPQSLAPSNPPRSTCKNNQRRNREHGKRRNSKVRTSVTTQGCNRRGDIRVNVFRSVILQIPVQNTNARHLASKRDDEEAGSGSSRLFVT